MALERYHVLFVVCLVITGILAVVTIVLFFVFDVRKIISIKTGIAVKKRMKQLANDRKKAEEFLTNAAGGPEQVTADTVLLEETARLDIPVSKEKKRLGVDEFFEITERKTVMQKEEAEL